MRRETRKRDVIGQRAIRRIRTRRSADVSPAAARGSGGGRKRSGGSGEGDDEGRARRGGASVRGALPSTVSNMAAASVIPSKVREK